MKTILFTFREKYGFDIEFVSATSIEDAWIILEGSGQRETICFKQGSHWEKRCYRDWETDRKSTRLNSSHSAKSRMPSSA